MYIIVLYIFLFQKIQCKFELFLNYFKIVDFQLNSTTLRVYLHDIY